MLFIQLEYMMFGFGFCLPYGILAATLELKYGVAEKILLYCMIPYILLCMIIFSKVVKKMRKKYNYEL